MVMQILESGVAAPAAEAVPRARRADAREDPGEHLPGGELGRGLRVPLRRARDGPRGDDLPAQRDNLLYIFCWLELDAWWSYVSRNWRETGGLGN